MMSKKLVTVISGGLGNQLFQLAKGLQSSTPGALQINSKYGSTRKNPDGLPDIYSYNLSKIISGSQGSDGLLKRKLFNFMLRAGVTSNANSRFSFRVPIFEIISSAALFLLEGEILKFAISRGIGYDHRLQRAKGILVGYFQTFRWLNEANVSETFGNLELLHVGPQLLELIEISTSKKPLVVHFRFGDYKNESDFGMPSEKYYKECLELVFSVRQFLEIWVFSDEMELAKAKFPKEYLANVRWIEEVDGTSAATLEAMRLGSGYIIANSTFSWWGAYLSKTPNSIVIAPSKWFINADDPVDLIPENWIRVDPW
jgi:hypothetical protein